MPAAQREEAARPLAVLDIDGVLADVRHRLDLLAPPAKDWEGFFAAARDDPPWPEGVTLARELALGHEVHYLTGRPERIRELTEAWLRRHALPPGELHMRPDRDRRPAARAKLGWLGQLAEGRVVAVVVDDDQAVCDALRAAGWPVRHADWSSGSTLLRDAQEADGRT